MNDEELADAFEGHRTHLRAVAYRMLGSVHEADDAVQEAWLRLERADVSTIANLGGWLTTVVSRICLDYLRSQASRREGPMEGHSDLPTDTPDPETDAVLADQVGSAVHILLSTLSPAERLAFVLHDLFAMPFEEVASVMGRSDTAVRQLASRGRRRVQRPEATSSAADRRTQQKIVDAFLSASRNGDLQQLVDLLDPDVVIRADGAAVTMGSARVTTGATAVARTFSGRALGARLVAIDGYAGATWSTHGELKVAFAFTVDGSRITEIELLADPEVLAALDIGEVS
ncbi:sigma-70 family RNA polymerase sigma factor [Solicola gregarius]|uniref:Sigma-70 family RNA polymerase sigma factor n=1 Tax=Solicola gregarius TaxID=2908642 RepID=A0AA46TEN0_9ACTN|nr:sigma-70 family RNA polymerase sigma factor [Solicola gregarius]UYM03407.1 sigma-70 family RNA polymerase sigma factor [Solicola gregarius]